jgi:biotin carboxylase
MSKKVLICGSSYSQFPAMEAAKRKGFEVVCVSPEYRYSDWIDYYEECDIKDYRKVFKIAKKHKIDAIIVPGTDFPFTGAYVSKKMGFPSISEEVALTCSDKHLMRKKLKKEGFLVPRFCKLEEDKKVKIDFPVLVKPVDCMAARGSSLCKNQEEVNAAYKIAKEFSISGNVIAEEFIEGMEFSIDSIVYDGKIHIFGFGDRNFFMLPYFIEYGHIVPSALSSDLIYEINKVFASAVRALGIDFGAAKGDVKLTNRGIFIVEIAARISGGFLSGWTTPWATGMVPTDFLIDIHTEEGPEWKQRKEIGTSVERAFMSIPGKLARIEYLENYNTDLSYCVNKELEDTSSGVKLLQLHKSIKGSILKFPHNSAFRVGSAISFSTNRERAIYQAQKGTQKIIFRLKPNQPETDKWIWEDNNFLMFEPGRNENDWHGCGIADALQYVKKLTNINITQLRNKLFWKYFYKGGIQGGIYFIDTYL